MRAILVHVHQIIKLQTRDRFRWALSSHRIFTIGTRAPRHPRNRPLLQAPANSRDIACDVIAMLYFVYWFINVNTPNDRWTSLIATNHNFQGVGCSLKLFGNNALPTCRCCIMKLALMRKKPAALKPTITKCVGRCRLLYLRSMRLIRAQRIRDILFNGLYKFTYLLTYFTLIVLVQQWLLVVDTVM